MSTLVRPTFRVLTLLCAACTCLVAAHAVNSVVDAWLQPLPSFQEETSRKAPVSREELPTPLALAPLARYTGLPDRLRAEVLAEGPKDEAVPTSLGLKLLGTLMGAHPSATFASVYEGPSRRTRSVWTGDELLGARVLAIERTRVLLRNGERLEFIGPVSDTGTGPRASTPSTPAEPTSTLHVAIRQVGPRDYELSRQDLESALANLNQVTTQARIIPAFRDGQPQGFKLFSIRPDSLFARLGLRNGDVLHRINGLPLDSVERGLEAFQKLREAPRIELEVERDGQPVRQTYSMR
jgi:general secretion pathway protein C